MFYYTSKLIKNNFQSATENIFYTLYHKNDSKIHEVLISQQKKNNSILEKYYDDYITQVSSSNMAISLESASTIFTLVNFLKPKSILDLGSGFTSLLFRLYRKERKEEVMVVSIDNNIHWLNKSSDFLEKYDLRDDNFYLSDEFFSHSRDKFDFIINDYSSGDERDQMTKMIPSFSTENASIIFDDMQHYGHKSNVMKLILFNRYNYMDLKHYTLDSINRYQWLLLNK